MTSKEALQDLFTISNKITKDKLNLDTKEIFERYKVIREDLEVLEALKKHFYEEYQLPTGQHSLLFRINGTPEYKKIKEWLETK